MAGEIFISYRRSDEAHARRLHALLKEQGVEAWFDAQVGAGQDWRAATAAALSKSRIFVLLFSKAASESEDIAKELAAATYSKKLVVPVRLENIEPTGAFLYELASRNWINAYDNTDARLTDLAKNLAGVVKGDVSSESIVQFQRASMRPPRIKPWMLAVAAGLVAIAAAGAFTLLGGAPKPVDGRIAFFAIDALSAEEKATAAATSSDILSTFAALQRDVAASTDTEGTPSRERLDRALELRAQYAISGVAARSGDMMSVSIRVEDAPSRSALWSETFDGPASRPAAIASRAAARLNDRLTCIITARASLKTDDMRIVARLPRACEAVRFVSPGSAERWTELVSLAPDSAWLRANEAMALLTAISTATPAAVEDLHQRARAALKRAEELDPQEPEVFLARIRLAAYEKATTAELDRMFQQALSKAPGNGNLNGNYASFLSAAGQSRDALPFGRQAIAGDPESGPKVLGLAEVYVRAGQPAQSAPLFAQRHLDFPDDNEWQAYLTAALFHGVGDLDTILADPPPSASRPTIACMQDIVRLARLATAASRAQAARRAADCNASGALLSRRAGDIRLMLGDYDFLFADPDARVEYNLFDPKAAPLRADPRFLPLMEHTGHLAYWRETGEPPDFCATEKAPVCAALDAPK